MKGLHICLCVLLILCCLSGCTVVIDTPSPSQNAGETVRTFSPSDAPSATQNISAQEKRGILKSLSSPGGGKIAYIFTENASAEPVEYALTILNKGEQLHYDASESIFRSTLLFDMEWGDDATLMVSLNEKESDDPEPMTVEGVMVMFGRTSSVEQ